MPTRQSPSGPTERRRDEEARKEGYFQFNFPNEGEASGAPMKTVTLRLNEN